MLWVPLKIEYELVHLLDILREFSPLLGIHYLDLLVAFHNGADLCLQ